MSYPRISGRSGQASQLTVQFLDGGIPADPFAIRMVKIYKDD
jgi:hypothetical protein